MIRFDCPTCGKHFSVADDFAGKAAKCKRCGNRLTVPQASQTIEITLEDLGLKNPAVSARLGPPPIPKRKLSMRERRLLADAESTVRAFQTFPLIDIRPLDGDPPNRYQVTYRVTGLACGAGGQFVRRDEHVAEIELTSEYPRQGPKCRMLTPIFHPNIDPTVICVGDHWTAGEQLVDLVIRIGQMIAYQVYNVRSPLDGEAARWADCNPDQLPIDSRSLWPPELQ